MRFRNSGRLMTENFKNTYKILAYNAIIILVTTALSAALILPNLIEIVESAQMQAVFGDIKAFFAALASGDSVFLQGFKESFTGEGGTVRELVWFLKSKLSEIVWSVVGLLILYFFSRFADTLCYFSIGSILNDKMATYAETSFSDAYIKNLGRASIYSIVYVPITLLCDLVIMGLCYLLLFWLFNFANLFAALFVSVTFIVLCQALKLTFTSMWLPAMIVGKEGIGKAMRLKGKMTAKQGQKIFLSYVTTVYLVLIVNVVAAVSTFGSALLLTIPASYFFFICMQFVNYYTVKGKKYFITYEKISFNPTWGESEQFFTEMENELGVPTVAQEETENDGSAAEKETDGVEK
ncbi:MAG: hypothetical protein IJY62_05540 [Clostridia bacterium]|nr:hypothetical protein [Clostridia bacterium]